MVAGRDAVQDAAVHDGQTGACDCTAQFRMVSTCFRKPIGTLPCLSAVSPALSSKQFWCWCGWWWPFLIFSGKIIIVARSVHMKDWERVPFNEAQDNVFCMQNLYFGRKLACSCVSSEEIHSEPFDVFCLLLLNVGNHLFKYLFVLWFRQPTLQQLRLCWWVL